MHAVHTCYCQAYTLGSAAQMLVTVYVGVQAEQQAVSSQLPRSLSQADSPEPLGAAYDCKEELPGQEVAGQVRLN